MEKMINIRNLWFKYDGPWIFKNLDLNISGRFNIFRGPNGCGKTTLAKIISGLIRPIRGTVEIDGVDIFNSDKAKEKLNEVVYVHDKPIILRGDVLYNIKFGVLMQKKMKLDEEELWKLIDYFEISDLVNEEAKKLSAGQRQIISLIRAFIVKPKYLVLDEPLQYLDEKRRELVKKYILKIIDNDSTKILIATHETELLYYADKIYLFNYDGSVKEHITQY